MPRRAIFILLVYFVTKPAALVFSQSNRTYTQLAPPAVKGTLYKPDPPLPAARVGILVVHRTSNVMGSLACPELAKRGYMVLCLNPRSDDRSLDKRLIGRIDV